MDKVSTEELKYAFIEAISEAHSEIGEFKLTRILVMKLIEVC